MFWEKCFKTIDMRKQLASYAARLDINTSRCSGIPSVVYGRPHLLIRLRVHLMNTHGKSSCQGEGEIVLGYSRVSCAVWAVGVFRIKEKVRVPMNVVN